MIGARYPILRLVLLFAVLIAGSWFASASIGKRLATLRGEAGEISKAELRPSRFLKDILQAAARLDLVLLDPARMAIILPPRDLVRELEAWRKRGRPTVPNAPYMISWEAAEQASAPSTVEAVLRGLHGRGPTDIGETIRLGTSRWNDLHAVAAVRDSSDASPSDGGASGGREPHWRAEVMFSSYDAPLRPKDQGAPLSYEVFGYFGIPDREGVKPATGPWHTVRGSSVDGHGKPALYRFRRTVPAGERLTLEILGRPAGGAVLIDASTRRPIKETEKLCERLGGYDPFTGLAKAECPRDESASYRVSLPASSAPRDVILDLTPVSQRPVALQTLLGELEQPLTLGWSTCGEHAATWGDYVVACRTSGWTVYGDGRPVILLCREAGEDRPECAIDWFDDTGKPALRKTMRLALTDHDGKPIVELDPLLESLALPDERARVQAAKIDGLKLQGLMGSGPADANGLIGALWRRHAAAPEPVQDGEPPTFVSKSYRLSIETDLQEALIEVVQSWKDFNAARDVAIAIIDASGRCWDSCEQSNRRGAIRAAYAGRIRATGAGEYLAGVDSDFSQGTWNQLGAESWLRRIGGRTEHQVAVPWFSDGPLYAPGSTFKSVTALAAIERAVATNDPDIEETIRGRRSGAKAVDALSLPAGVVATPGYVEFPHPVGYPPLSTCGDGRERLRIDGRARICNLGAPAAPVDPKETGCPGTSPILGLCEATRKSLNNYFIALGAALEQHSPSHITGDAGETPVVAMARRLLPEFFPLIRSEPDLGHRWSRFNANGFSALESEEGFYAKVSPLYVLGQNAYGHNMQTNVAAVASVYASIATGCRVTPWLEGGAEECQPLFSSDRSTNSRGISLMRETLVKGLWAVVNRGGTASSAFRNSSIRDSVHAKTGTASIVGKGNSTWLAGWVEPAEDAAPSNRYAFACMVTATSGTGGRVCGNLMREVIERLEMSPR